MKGVLPKPKRSQYLDFGAYRLATKAYRVSMVNATIAFPIASLTTTALDCALQEYHASLAGNRVLKEERLRRARDGLPYLRAKRSVLTVDDPITFYQPDAFTMQSNIPMDLLRTCMFDDLRDDPETLYSLCQVSRQFYVVVFPILMAESRELFGAQGTPMALLLYNDQCVELRRLSLKKKKKKKKKLRGGTKWFTRMLHVSSSLFDDDDDDIDPIQQCQEIIQLAINTHGSIDAINSFPQRAIEKKEAQEAERVFAQLKAPLLVEEVNTLLIAKGYAVLQVEIRPPKGFESAKPLLRWTNKRAKYAADYAGISGSFLGDISAYVFQCQIGHALKITNIIGYSLKPGLLPLFNIIFSIGDLPKPIAGIRLTHQLLVYLNSARPRFFERILSNDEWARQVQMVFSKECLKNVMSAYYNTRIVIIWSYDMPPRFHGFKQNLRVQAMQEAVLYLEPVIFMNVDGSASLYNYNILHAISCRPNIFQ